MTEAKTAASHCAAGSEAGAGAGQQRTYVICNFSDGGNDRLRKVLRLRERLGHLQLVAPATKPEKPREDSNTLVLGKRPNPFGLLRLLGLQKLKSRLERNWYFPGIHLLFTRVATTRLTTLIAADLARGDRVTVMTIAPPHGLGLVGLQLKERFPQIRWVIDWQDLWSYDDNYYLLTPARWRPRLRRLEAQMLASADLNITTNRVAEAVLRDQYQVPTDRLTHIHHHFDRSDFTGASTTSGADPLAAAAPAASANPALKIGFLGTLFKPPRVPGQALMEVICAARRAGVAVELHLHGLLTAADQAIVAAADGVHWHGAVSHEESVGQLQDYDYLLLLLADLPNSKAVMSIKLPHYLAVQQPILAVVPSDSAVAETVQQTGSGVVIASEGDWQTALTDLLSQGRSAPTIANYVAQRKSQAIEQYAWEQVQQQWYQALTDH